MAKSERLVRGELISATRCDPLFPKPRATSTAAAFGLRYERKLFRAFKKSKFSVEHNPWFMFEDSVGRAWCSPDFILDQIKYLVVVECKYTYVPNAFQKLISLYIPIVQKALKKPAFPLVICKNLTPDAPKPALCIGDALCPSTNYLYQWMGTEPL